MLTIINMIAAARRFAKDTSGAVTVDWVALTAAVVIIGIGIVYSVFGTGTDGVNGLVTNLTSQLGTAATNIDGHITAVDLPGDTASE
ncbi:MAG: hypothetical protein ACPGGK_03130 [Pikeienuella sp.]